jgi:hypothetical protein
MKIEDWIILSFLMVTSFTIMVTIRNKWQIKQAKKEIEYLDELQKALEIYSKELEVLNTCDN